MKNIKEFFGKNLKDIEKKINIEFNRKKTNVSLWLDKTPSGFKASMLFKR